jgi:hypothetical protein
MDFASLQHIGVRKSTTHGVSTPRYVPPSGFDHPLDGLLLPSPSRPCFVPAALLGFTLRSVPLSKGLRGVSARTNPPAVSPDAIVVTGATTRRAKPRLLGFTPFESPSHAGPGLTCRPAGCSLGFLPFQGLPTRTLTGIPPGLLSRASSGCFRRNNPKRRPRVSIGSRFASSALAGKPA